MEWKYPIIGLAIGGVLAWLRVSKGGGRTTMTPAGAFGPATGYA